MPVSEEEKSYLHKNDGTNNEAYNEYAISDGIWTRLDAKANADIMDMLYTRARKKIRQRGGMLTTQQALGLVLKEDKEEILNEEVVEKLRKEGYPLLADAFRNEKTRKDAMRVIQSMIVDVESFD